MEPSRGKPRLLDLFCGAGGATRGYQLAGFYVIGVDLKPQPNYVGDEFFQADALDVCHRLSYHAEAIHASPPCQRYIRSGNVDREKHPDLLGPTRALLEQTGIPWVIENVPGAPMRADVLLCGSMFGLEVRRAPLVRVERPDPSVGAGVRSHAPRGRCVRASPRSGRCLAGDAAEQSTYVVARDGDRLDDCARARERDTAGVHDLDRNPTPRVPGGCPK